MAGVASLSFSDDCMSVAGVIDFVSVIDLEAKGEHWLRERAPLVCRVDLSAVSDCNSAGTALLLSWLRTANSVGKQLNIEHLPQSLSALMRLGGLDRLLLAQPSDATLS